MPSYNVTRATLEQREKGSFAIVTKCLRLVTELTEKVNPKPKLEGECHPGDEGGGNKGEGGGGKGLSVPLAAAFLVSEMSGSGVFALPKALANTGWWGLLLMLVLCVAVGFSGTRLALCWMILEEQWEEYRSPCRRPYPAIAYRALGRPGSYLTVVAQQVTLVGVCTVLLLLAAQLLESLTGFAFQDLGGQCSCIIILGIAVIPATWLATPKDFWPASVVAVVVMICQCLAVMVKVVLQGAVGPPEKRYSQPSFSSFFLGFGTILFSFGGAATFPTIQNDMKNRSKFPQSVVITFIVLLLLYGSLSAIGYGFLGTEITTNILLDISGPEITVIRSFTFVHLIFAFIILFNPVAQFLEDCLGVPREFGWRRCCLRSSIVVLEVLLGLAIPDFGAILNLVGGSTIAFMSFVLPPICYLRLCDSRDESGNPRRQVGLIERSVLIGVLILGVIGGVVTTYTASSAIVSPGALQRSCFN
ncbi:uncharacterized protein [Palaemon carinicauda]|uniref:uncharacterized protein n=1 Tax=Palaemon carinicauda TaxID=392227 RepID=UPI0035B5CC1B